MIWKIISKIKLDSAENIAKSLKDNAQTEAERIRKDASVEAKEMKFNALKEFEQEYKEKRLEISNLEKRLIQKEDNIDRKADILEKKELEISNKDKELKHYQEKLVSKENKLKEAIEEEIRKLEKISHMSVDQAKSELKERFIQEAEYDSGKRIKEIEEELQRKSKELAQEIITMAIQRSAAEHVVETTVSVVPLPSDEMKGRIIGREGRNIRTFENLTGVDLIIDDTPEAVALSSFDPVRREIARIALEKLISDGRIHPARIEEMVQKADKEVQEEILRAGEEAVFDVGVGNINPELVRLIGRLKYRTSYGQNVLQHSKEVAYIAGLMAAQLNMDVAIAKRAGFLHDLGKSVDRELEGTHQEIGMELAKKYGESAIIVNAIGAHHEDIVAETPYAVLIQAADAISAARPGARRETLEYYIKRVEKLENVAKSFVGVEKVFAIQAGREVRVIVDYQDITDEEAIILSRNIARKIEKEVEYPGTIKVTIIRETRVIDYAK
ncbi:MAG TPA: ribonuclease Y [Firmicutes bacterium]|nr:ribonuclease Y [Bacillota bacterium]